MLIVIVTAPAKATSEIVDTLPYFLNTGNAALSGTHLLSQTVVGQSIYTVKWASDSYETHEYDDSYIYLKEDHSGAPVPGGLHIQ